jgi:hypothetical protein
MKQNLVSVEIIGLQKMLKLVSLYPETWADMVLHVCHCSSFIGNGDGVNWAGRHQVSIVKCTVLLSFVFIGKFAW